MSFPVKKKNGFNLSREPELVERVPKRHERGKRAGPKGKNLLVAASSFIGGGSAKLRSAPFN